MLAVKDGLSQKYLAYLLGIRPQTLSEALAKLEEQGYVERRKDENDRRVMLVYLTDDGRERAKEIDARREQRAEDIFSVLTDEEKEQLARILAKLDAGIEQQGECSEGDGGADDVFPDDDEEEAAIGDIED
jgi:DNA-binding MarR family transcriptional regulator